MVHGLATWGKCLSLTAVSNDVRAEWHAADNVGVVSFGVWCRDMIKALFSDGCAMIDSIVSLMAMLN